MKYLLTIEQIIEAMERHGVDRPYNSNSRTEQQLSMESYLRENHEPSV